MPHVALSELCCSVLFCNDCGFCARLVTHSSVSVSLAGWLTLLVVVSVAAVAVVTVAVAIAAVVVVAVAAAAVMRRRSGSR